MNKHDLSWAEAARIEEYEQARRADADGGLIRKSVLAIMLLMAICSPYLVIFLIDYCKGLK